MAILRAFCDYLNVSVPGGDLSGLSERLDPLVILAGGSEVHSGFKLGKWGMVKYRVRGPVGVVSLSGDAMATLRDAGLLRAVVTVLGYADDEAVRPHRVTRLDATLDVQVDGYLVCPRLYRRGKQRGIHLSQKVVPPRRVRKYFGTCATSGRDTGTVYIGKYNPGVSAKVYDKRNHLLERAIEEHGGHPSVRQDHDPGPLTRYEILCGRKVGATLRDVLDPTALFWNYAGDLLPRPDGVPKWEPHAMGFEVDKREYDPVQQLFSLLAYSPDVARILRLVHEIGGPTTDVGAKRLRSVLVQMKLGGAGETPAWTLSDKAALSQVPALPGASAQR